MQADITLQDNAFFITGNVNFSNVMSVYKKSLSQLCKCPELTFDFSQLKAADSSGLALIVEWIKFAKQHNQSICFKNLSTDLLSIAKAARLDHLIISA